MESLGVNPVLLLAQLVSFGILYLVFSKFLFPIIQKALTTRRQAVADTLSGRQEIEAKLAQLAIDQEQARLQQQHDAETLLTQARQSAASTRKELLAKAQEDSARLLTEARKQIEQDRLQAQKELKTYTKSMADSIVKQLLSNKATDSSWRAKTVDRSIEDLTSSS